MARAIGHPGLCLPCRERHGDERGAEVVRADGSPRDRPLEELWPVDASALQVGPELVGQVVDVERHALLLKDPRSLLEDGRPTRAPGAESADDARIEVPVARVVRLVLVQRDPAANEVDVGPFEIG